MVNTAVIGASGFVGRHLFSRYREVYPDALGTCFSQRESCLHQFDLRQPDLAPFDLAGHGVRAVLIASARPNVSYCEQHKEEARAVNVKGTLDLVAQVVGLGLQPIFLSSDYVFDGNAGGYDDDAPMNPGTEYGRQKKFVEDAIPRMTDNYLILRLSKIYGIQMDDGSLLDDLASTLLAGKEVRAAVDQIFSPTYVADLVNAIIALQDLGLRGTFNICSLECRSRYEVAMAMARSLGVPDSRVSSIALHDLPSMSKRPLNTSMRCSRLGVATFQRFTPLQTGIDAMAAQWKRRHPAEIVPLKAR